MPLAFLGFLQLSLADILDIILLGLIIFFMFRWIKGSSAMSIFVAIVSLYIIRIVVEAFNMRLMTAIMDMVLDLGLIALIIIFQPEIRKFLIRLGNRYMNSSQGKAIMDKILGRKTANVIRGNIYNEPSIVVDTHVKRISGKFGLTKETDPVKIEMDLMKILPKEQWILYNIHIIRLGRTICTARKPQCDKCFLRDLCKSGNHSQ